MPIIALDWPENTAAGIAKAAPAPALSFKNSRRLTSDFNTDGSFRRHESTAGGYTVNDLARKSSRGLTVPIRWTSIATKKEKQAVGASGSTLRCQVLLVDRDQSHSHNFASLGTVL